MLHKTSFLEGSYSYILDKFETLNGSSVNSGLVAKLMNGGVKVVLKCVDTN